MMSDRPAPIPPTPIRYLRFWIPCAGILILDQLSKWLVASSLPFNTYFWNWGSDPVPVIDGLWYVVHIGNEGAAWGILSGYGWLLALIAVGALCFIYWFRHEIGLQTHRVQYCFGLLCGGIVGNLIDRALHGHVIDFIDVHIPSIEWIGFTGYRWPAFNIADAAISSGVIGYILITMWPNRQPSQGKLEGADQGAGGRTKA